MSKSFRKVLHERKAEPKGYLPFVAKCLKDVWLVSMGFCLWVTLVSTSLLIVWPDLGQDNETLEQVLWLNESFWVMEIIRNFC